MPDAARILSNHKCPMKTPMIPSPIPHALGGMVIKGCPNVLVGGLPAARVGDQLLCMGPPPHPDVIVKGSSSVFIGGLPAARKGDLTAMGGKIQLGTPKVKIGG